MPGPSGSSRRPTRPGSTRSRARADRRGHHLTGADPDRHHVVHAGNPGQLHDPLGVGLLHVPHDGREQRRRQIQRIEGQLVEERSLIVPQRQVGRIALRAKCGAVPQRVHLRGGRRRRRSAHLLREALEQRHGERVGLAAEPSDVPRRDLDLAGELRAPGDQRRRAACHQSDAADGGPSGRRQRDQEQRRRPQPGVPVRPAASRTPHQHADDGRGERDPDPRHRPRRGSRLGPVAAEQGGARYQQRGGGHQDRELPAQPEPDGDPVGRRGDPPPQAADEIGRRDQQGDADQDPRPSTREVSGATARCRRP